MNKFQEKYGSSEYEITGNPAIDMTGACITFYRNRKSKLKSITLRNDYYEIFEEYIKSRAEVKVGEIFSWEGIDILTSELDLNEPLYPVFYTEEELKNME